MELAVVGMLVDDERHVQVLRRLAVSAAGERLTTVSPETSKPLTTPR